MGNRILSRTFAPGLLALLILTFGCGSPSEPSKLSVTSITPRIATPGTSTDVRISGTGFRQGATVSVGVAATNVAVVNDRLINATVPGQAVGALDVVVTNPGGESSKLTGGFTIEAQAAPPAFAVTSVAPAAGLSGDGVSVLGTGFTAGARVTVDGLQASFASVVSATLIRFGPPEHAPGPVDVVVTNGDGQTAALPQGFTYQLVTLSVNADALTTGTPLKISWVAPSGRSTFDWIALYKPASPHVAYEDVWWSYTNGAATGTFTIPAPPPGVYEFRYFANDSYDLTVKSGLITVTSAAPASRHFLNSPLR